MRLGVVASSSRYASGTLSCGRHWSSTGPRTWPKHRRRPRHPSKPPPCRCPAPDSRFHIVPALRISWRHCPMGRELAGNADVRLDARRVCGNARGLAGDLGDPGRRWALRTDRRHNWSRRQTAAGPTRPRRFPPAATCGPARRSTWPRARPISRLPAAPRSRSTARACWKSSPTPVPACWSATLPPRPRRSGRTASPCNCRRRRWWTWARSFASSSAADGRSQMDVDRRGGRVANRQWRHAAPSGKGAGRPARIGLRGVFVTIEAGDRNARLQVPHDRTALGQGLRRRLAASREDFRRRRPAGRHSYSGPVEALLDGRGQSTGGLALRVGHLRRWREAGQAPPRPRQGSPREEDQHVYLARVQWLPPQPPQRSRRATQRYTLYGFAGDSPPPVEGDPAEHGWTRICRVDTDEFFSVPPANSRPRAAGRVHRRGPPGKWAAAAFLLWVMLPHNKSQSSPYVQAETRLSASSTSMRTRKGLGIREKPEGRPLAVSRCVKEEN